MTAIKAAQAAQFLKALDSRIHAVLIYGSDAGLVSERARAAAERLAAASSPPGEILRIVDSDLDNEPDRLVVELQTLPMFGGPKVVQTTASRRINAHVLKPLLEQGAMAASLVVEAGNLRSEDPLRAAFEKASTAAAVPCFPDEARDLESLARDTLREAGAAIVPDALRVLVARLGADRALSRGELEKLVLYTRGKHEIDVDDVNAVVGDASELAIDKIALAAAARAPDKALAEFDRVVASGESIQTVILAVQRYFLRLHRLRAAIDSGRSLDEAIREIRPPVHFKLRAQLEQHCRAWRSDALMAAIARIGRTARDARLASALEFPLAANLLLDLASVPSGSSPLRC